MVDYNKELYHYGIPGMKWGIKRYSKNGALTPEGKKRIAYYNKRLNKQSATVKTYERMRDKARIERDKYVTNSKNKAKNLFISGQRYIAKQQLNKKVSSLEFEAKRGQNKLKKIMKKMNRELGDNIEMNVYLSDIYGTPYDYYDIREKK